MAGKKKKTTVAASCDWKAPGGLSPTPVPDDKNIVFRYKGNFRWTGVKTEKYKTYDGDGWTAIVRNVLIGNHGETAKFHLRYFEIAPNGHSSLERHRHEHVVVCIRGKGKLRMGGKNLSLGYLDTAYIAPNTVHQLSNPYKEPFGFFCMVNAKRDRPKPIS